jgi:DNA-binding transcriptional ArsR family regulator
MTYGKVLAALADPTRRALFERIRRRACTVGELAEHAGIRQPTVSQHLRVLRKARLVSDRREGTRRYYRASREGLAELRRYVESMWDDVLAAYAEADPTPPARRRRTTEQPPVRPHRTKPRGGR